MERINSPLQFLNLFFDSIALFVSFIISLFISKNRLTDLPDISSGIDAPEVILGIAFVLLWAIISITLGLYETLKIESFVLELVLLFKSLLFQMVFVISTLFFIKSVLLSRFFLIVYLTIFLILILIIRFATFLFRKRKRIGNKMVRKVVLVGDSENMRKFANIVKTKKELGLQIVYALSESDISQEPLKRNLPAPSLIKLLNSEEIDDVYVTPGKLTHFEFNTLLSIIDEYPVRIKIIPDNADYTPDQYQQSMIENVPLISLKMDLLDRLKWRLFKRVLDLIIAFVSLLFIFIWLYPLIALIIKMTSKGPVIFKQERWGRKNKRFMVYKFRTMKFEPEPFESESEYIQASKDDKRVTKIGKFLRRSSLDELPQIFNVIAGHMSIVGPRPHPTPLNLESKTTVKKYLKRHLVKPGITGWAQVNGLRGETKKSGRMQKRVEYDLWYIENWSALLDIQIIFLTIWKMIKGDANAH